MGRNTKIPFTDHTFNPWIGCTKVSPGCDHCYAEAQDKYRGWTPDGWGAGKPRHRTTPTNWKKPLQWNTAAANDNRPARVFCASLADVFDNEVPQAWRDELFALIKATPNLEWIIITKRIGNAKKMLPADWGDGYPNVRLIATVTTQAEADRDVPTLLDTPAAVHGVSIEPQLGHIHLGYIGWPDGSGAFNRDGINALLGMDYRNFRHGARMAKLDWVICGAESGPHARPFNEVMAMSLRDQCQAAHIAFFYKQIIVNGRKVETPELRGQRWTQHPTHPIRKAA